MLEMIKSYYVEKSEGIHEKWKELEIEENQLEIVE
jgi:hypothetical protein